MPFEDRFGMADPFSRGSFQLKLVENPFTEKFLREEIEFYDLPRTYSKKGVNVQLIKTVGRLDDYLNKNWRITDDLRVPGLWIDGELWMSLTFMEIQSAYVPLAMTEGVVGTAGLGLGYFPLRAASNETVDAVHVYEVNPRVIEFFTETFKDRPEMEKIVIHEGDVRKLAIYNQKKRQPRFDFFFMDIYQTLLGEDVIQDIGLFDKKVATQEYRFWGEERVILDAFMAGEHPRMIPGLDRAFLDTWQKTTMDPEDPELAKTFLSELYEPLTDEEYREAVLTPLGFFQ